MLKKLLYLFFPKAWLPLQFIRDRDLADAPRPLTDEHGLLSGDPPLQNEAVFPGNHIDVRAVVFRNEFPKPPFGADDHDVPVDIVGVLRVHHPAGFGADHGLAGHGHGDVFLVEPLFFPVKDCLGSEFACQDLRVRGEEAVGGNVEGRGILSRKTRIRVFPDCTAPDRNQNFRAFRGSQPGITADNRLLQFLGHRGRENRLPDFPADPLQGLGVVNIQRG